jgi:hypothetical protein
VYSRIGREATKIGGWCCDWLIISWWRSTIPADGAGQDAVRMPPVWMPGCKVVPSLDRQVIDATISPVSHSEGPLDRTASIAINGFGINGAAGADGSRYSVLLARKSTASAGMSTRISNEMEIALMRH